ARVRQRLHALGIAVPLAGATATAATATGLAAWPWWAKMSVVAAVATTPPAALMVASAVRASNATPVVAAVSKDTPALRTPRTSRRAATLPPALATAAVAVPSEEPSLVVAPESTSRPARSRARSDAPSTLAAETALIERALAAIESGDIEAAELALRQHAERFPHGWLRRERQRAQDRLKRRSPSVEGTHPQPME